MSTIISFLILAVLVLAALALLPHATRGASVLRCAWPLFRFLLGVGIFLGVDQVLNLVLGPMMIHETLLVIWAWMWKNFLGDLWAILQSHKDLTLFVILVPLATVGLLKERHARVVARRAAKEVNND
jgi:hypothetical protein